MTYNTIITMPQARAMLYKVIEEMDADSLETLCHDHINEDIEVFEPEDDEWQQVSEKEWHWDNYRIHYTPPDKDMPNSHGVYDLYILKNGLWTQEAGFRTLDEAKAAAA